MSITNAAGRLVNNHFHALTHRNYRYYWFGQCVSLIGTWVQNIGQAWLVLTLTGSPFLLGVVGTVQFLPVTFLSLFAGVVIDKFPKKSILLTTQTVAMLLAFSLAILVFTGHVRYGYIVALAFLLGLNNSFDMPTRQSFPIEIVGKGDLMNAIALNSTTFNLARVLGPAIGAFLMAYLGAGWCFLLNGFSFLAVIYGLLRMEPVPYVRKKRSDAGVWKEIGDGIAYIAGDKVLAKTILLLTVIGTLGFNFNVLIPTFTMSVLHMEEKTFGFLMSCLGIGSLTGALTMSFRSKKGPRMGINVFCCIAVSILLILTGLTRNYLWTGLLLALTGVSTILFATNCNSMLQIQSKDEYRARVMSVYSLVFAGSTPIGNFIAGVAADRFGPDGALILCGVLIFVPVAAILYLFRRKRIEAEPTEDPLP